MGVRLAATLLVVLLLLRTVVRGGGGGAGSGINEGPIAAVFSNIPQSRRQLLGAQFEGVQSSGAGSSRLREVPTEQYLISAKFVPISIAANDDHSSTYAFIGPEQYNQWKQSNVLYVGTTFTNQGDYREDVPAISSRNLDTLDFALISFSQQSLLKIDVKYRDHFLVKYVYGFNSSDFAYFVIVQKQSHLPGQEELGYVTRLARVCINDANYDSYTEVTLQCLVKESGEKEKVPIII
ncbi:hypothetical protein U1Q18_045639 [Sarracenia purpurea var. burkii]